MRDMTSSRADIEDSRKCCFEGGKGRFANACGDMSPVMLLAGDDIPMPRDDADGRGEGIRSLTGEGSVEDESLAFSSIRALRGTSDRFRSWVGSEGLARPSVEV